MFLLTFGVQVRAAAMLKWESSAQRLCFQVSGLSRGVLHSESMRVGGVQQGSRISHNC